MKLTIEDLLLVQEGLRALSERKLKPASSLRVARWKQRVNTELGPYTEQRNNLIIKYGEEHEKTGEPYLKPEMKGWDQFIADNAEMMKEKAQVPLEPLTEDDLVDIEPKWVEFLLPIIK